MSQSFSDLDVVAEMEVIRGPKAEKPADTTEEKSA